MLFTTHAVATIGLGKLMGLKTARDWFLAFLFGVLVDLDHLKIFRPKYFKDGSWRKFFNRELPIRSFLQEPISIFWVVPLSLYLQTPIPMAAWGLHVFMDYLVDGVRKPFWPFLDLTLTRGVLPAPIILEFFLIPVLPLFYFAW